MENSPLVSVIIPTYNRAERVCEAVESVLKQDYTTVEIIVVDDGSTDNTQRLLKKYQKKISVLHQENRGVSAARNIGIRHSKGDYIALLDSDDLWERQKLSCQIEFFKNNPGALICQTEEIWIRNGRRVNPKNRHKKPSGMIFEASLALCLVSPSAVMIKKTLFDSVGLFDEALTACEDYDLWLRISLKYPIYLTPEPCVIKKGGHDDQLSAAPGLDRFRIMSLQKLLSETELPENYRKKTLEVLLTKCRIYAQGCEKRGRTEEAEHYREIIETYCT